MHFTVCWQTEYLVNVTEMVHLVNLHQTKRGLMVYYSKHRAQDSCTFKTLNEHLLSLKNLLM